MLYSVRLFQLLKNQLSEIFRKIFSFLKILRSIRPHAWHFQKKTQTSNYKDLCMTSLSKSIILKHF